MTLAARHSLKRSVLGYKILALLLLLLLINAPNTYSLKSDSKGLNIDQVIGRDAVDAAERWRVDGRLMAGADNVFIIERGLTLFGIDSESGAQLWAYADARAGIDHVMIEKGVVIALAYATNQTTFKEYWILIKLDLKTGAEISREVLPGKFYRYGYQRQLPGDKVMRLEDKLDGQWHFYTGAGEQLLPPFKSWAKGPFDMFDDYFVFDRAKDLLIYQHEASYQSSPVQAFQLSTHKPLWHKTLEGHCEKKSLLADNKLYLICDNRVVVLNASDGSTYKQYDFDDKPYLLLAVNGDILMKLEYDDALYYLPSADDSGFQRANPGMDVNIGGLFRAFFAYGKNANIWLAPDNASALVQHNRQFTLYSLPDYKLQWKVRIPAQNLQGHDSYVTHDLVWTEDRLYAQVHKTYLAFDRHSGDIEWQHIPRKTNGVESLVLVGSSVASADFQAAASEAEEQSSLLFGMPHMEAVGYLILLLLLILPLSAKGKNKLYALPVGVFILVEYLGCNQLISLGVFVGVYGYLKYLNSQSADAESLGKQIVKDIKTLLFKMSVVLGILILCLLLSYVYFKVYKPSTISPYSPAELDQVLNLRHDVKRHPDWIFITVGCKTVGSCLYAVNVHSGKVYQPAIHAFNDNDGAGRFASDNNRLLLYSRERLGLVEYLSGLDEIHFYSFFASRTIGSHYFLDLDSGDLTRVNDEIKPLNEYRTKKLGLLADGVLSVVWKEELGSFVLIYLKKAASGEYHVAKELKLMDSDSFMLSDDSSRLVLFSESYSNPAYAIPFSNAYDITGYDIATGETTLHKTQGKFYGISEDYRRAAYLIVEEDGSQAVRIAYLDDPDKGYKDILRGDWINSPLAYQTPLYSFEIAEEREKMTRSFLGKLEEYERMPEPLLFFNEQYTKAAWLNSVVSDAGVEQSLMLIDIDSGERIELASKTASMPVAGKDDYPRDWIQIYGFSDDGQRLLFNHDHQWLHAEVADGKLMLIAEDNGGSASSPIFSPDGSRLVWREWSIADSGEREYFVVAYEDGERRELYQSQDKPELEWFSSDQLLLTEQDKKTLYLINANDGTKQTLYPR